MSCADFTPLISSLGLLRAWSPGNTPSLVTVPADHALLLFVVWCQVQQWHRSYEELSGRVAVTPRWLTARRLRWWHRLCWLMNLLCRFYYHNYIMQGQCRVVHICYWFCTRFLEYNYQTCVICSAEMNDHEMLLNDSIQLLWKYMLINLRDILFSKLRSISSCVLRHHSQEDV